VHLIYVSILVLLDDAYRHMPQEEANYLMDVSILVLLDDAYRPSLSLLIIIYTFCFNPCSSGWCLPAIIVVPASLKLNWVSILVLLDDAYRPGMADGVRNFIRVSILVLLDDAYRPQYLEEIADLYKSVSILVLLDDAYRHTQQCLQNTHLIMFQSLFFWMMPTG